MVVEKLIELREMLSKKEDKISSDDPAYQLGVSIVPRKIQEFLMQKQPSANWAFEGSVGKGSWSRTPWIAVYDQRATSRASDGFFVTMIFTENYQDLYMVLMNTSSSHFNYTPFVLNKSQVGTLQGFTAGPIPKKQLSESGRGRGPDFEASTLLWKKFGVNAADMKDFETDLLSLTAHYAGLVGKMMSQFPKEKPFKDNPFMLR